MFPRRTIGCESRSTDAEAPAARDCARRIAARSRAYVGRDRRVHAPAVQRPFPGVIESGARARCLRPNGEADMITVPAATFGSP